MIVRELRGKGLLKTTARKWCFWRNRNQDGDPMGRHPEKKTAAISTPPPTWAVRCRCRELGVDRAVVDARQSQHFQQRSPVPQGRLFPEMSQLQHIGFAP